MRNAHLFLVLAVVLLGTSAHARYFSPREGNFLSPDRAGMIDGPNLYQYVRGQPTMHTDPTGMFSDVDPDLPQFNEVLLAALWIDTAISLWSLREPPCSIPNWSQVKQALTEAVTEKDIAIGFNPAVWQPRLGGARPLPAFTDPSLKTVWLTPAAGHMSIVSQGAVVWEPASVPTASGFKHINSWIGLLGHELTHAAGYAGTTFATETLANQVGVFLESQNPNYLPLDPAPYNAGAAPP